jgi:uncharacterized CHY-type Zn-finger protein
MKILKNNYKSHSEYPKQITCPNCQSELEYEKDDLTHVFWRTEGWTKTSIKYRGFICPCCRYEIGIEDLIVT